MEENQDLRDVKPFIQPLLPIASNVLIRPIIKPESRDGIDNTEDTAQDVIDFDRKDVLFPGSRIGYSLKLNYLFLDARFFIMKTTTVNNIVLSKKSGIWVTQSNENKLTNVFNGNCNIILIFCVEGETSFAGFGKLASALNLNSEHIDWTLSTNHIIPTPSGYFKVDWLCRNTLPFDFTMHLRNRLDNDKLVMHSLDGKEIYFEVGKEICKLFPYDNESNLSKIIKELHEKKQSQKCRIDSEKRTKANKRLLRGYSISNLHSNKYQSRTSNSFLERTGYDYNPSLRQYPRVYPHSNSSRNYFKPRGRILSSRRYYHFPLKDSNISEQTVDTNFSVETTLTSKIEDDNDSNDEIGNSYFNIKTLVKGNKVLVIGVGGIGCELLKCLAQAGFCTMEIVDGNVVKLTDLNRQFLYNASHLDKLKARVARRAMIVRFPSLDITCHVKNIINNEFCTSWYKQFSLVFNTVRDIETKIHINRLCMAADVPLIDSSVNGFTGEVKVFIKGLTQCYECTPKPTVTSYTKSTIRNTPSESIHCVIWAKNLFRHLFGGEPNEENEVAPYLLDARIKDSTELNSIYVAGRGQTKTVAEQCDYNVNTLLDHLFNKDIITLSHFKELWNDRPPVPIAREQFTDVQIESGAEEDANNLLDKEDWNLHKCLAVFRKSFETLKQNQGNVNVWKKNNKNILDFVISCCNLRCFVFGIDKPSLFEVKAMVDVITPCISSTGAIVAGMMLSQGFNVLQEVTNKLTDVYLCNDPNENKMIMFHGETLLPPNSNCCTCTKRAEVTVCTNIEKTTVWQLNNLILKELFHMVQPEMSFNTEEIITIGDDITSSAIASKSLLDFGIVYGSMYVVNDFLQHYKLFLHFEKQNSENVDELFTVITNYVDKE